MSSQTSKILFIGAGVWSAKVSKIIHEQDPNLEVQVIGAREFLDWSDNSSEYRNALHGNEFVWITTNPSSQSKVLTKLKNIKTKVILEKPIAQNHFELQEIKDAISCSSSDIYLSQPWTYSEIWKKSLFLLSENKSLNKILFKRGDYKVRSDIAPGIDWIPHEIYLVASLVEQYATKNSEVEVEVSSYSPKRISLNVKIGTRLYLEIESGLFPVRIAQASGFANQDLIMTSNFLTGEIKYLETIGVQTELLPTDSSILNMIRHFQSNSPNLNWSLIFKLYSSFLT
jgi:hypothetical protein